MKARLTSNIREARVTIIAVLKAANILLVLLGYRIDSDKIVLWAEIQTCENIFFHLSIDTLTL